MNYLLYGLEEFLIKKQVKKIIIDNNIDSININEYDLENNSIKDIIDDALTLSLFSEKKLIIVNNSYIFTGTTNKKLPEQNTEELLNYLNNKNDNTIMIFIINKESIDSRKKIVSQFKTKGIVKEFNKIDNIRNFVLEMIKPYNIDHVNLLIDRVGSNLNILEQEITKLKIYKDDDINITDQDVVDVTTKTIDVDIFNLIENIICNNKEKALESYNEMLKLNEEPIKIIIMLANQFRLMYQAKQLLKKGFSEKDIATNLEIHPYRVKLALEKSRNIKDETLLEYLNELSDLDLNIKSGLIDKNIGLELFIIKI